EDPTRERSAGAINERVAAAETRIDLDDAHGARRGQEDLHIDRTAASWQCVDDVGGQAHEPSVLLGASLGYLAGADLKATARNGAECTAFRAGPNVHCVLDSRSDGLDNQIVPQAGFQL